MKMFLSKRITIFSVVVFATLTPSISSSKNGRKLFKPHFEFAIDMYRDISSDFGDKNLAFSPYIVNSVLAMLFLGTSSFSSSSKQLRQVLHLSNISYVDVHKSFKDIVNNFDDNYYQPMLNMGRGIFFQNGTSISFPYMGALSELYHVKTNSLDFDSGDCGLLRDTVSHWMRSVTNKWDKGDLLGNAMQCDAKLLAVGTTYLNNHLLHPFRTVDTFKEGLFFLRDNKRLKVPMMSGRFELPLGYSKVLECSVLEMPYVQNRISLFILLPDDPQDGLKQLERNLTSKNLKAVFSTLKNEVVNVRIPRFHLTSTIDLRTSLERAGLSALFNKSNSDFSLITVDEKIFMSSMPHKSSFQFSEEAGDSKNSSNSFVDRNGLFNHYFEADHPFIFLVWDYFTGMVVLFGKVLDPSKD